MCLKKFLLKQTLRKINNSGEKFCNNLSCFFLTPITPVLLSGNLLNYTGCSIITSRTIRVKSRILKQFLLYFKTLSNLEQCPTWVRSPLIQPYDLIIAGRGPTIHFLIILCVNPKSIRYCGQLGKSRTMSQLNFFRLGSPK